VESSADSPSGAIRETPHPCAWRMGRSTGRVSDTMTIDLIDRLPHVLQELELRAHGAELLRVEQDRGEAERRA
jgi:hypothetical protein